MHVLTFLSSFFGFAAPTYIDPNTGGMLFQILAVLFAAFSGIMLFFSRQIKTVFNKLRRKLRKEQDIELEESNQEE